MKKVMRLVNGNWIELGKEESPRIIIDSEVKENLSSVDIMLINHLLDHIGPVIVLGRYDKEDMIRKLNELTKDGFPTVEPGQKNCICINIPSNSSTHVYEFIYTPERRECKLNSKSAPFGSSPNFDNDFNDWFIEKCRSMEENKTSEDFIKTEEKYIPEISREALLRFLKGIKEDSSPVPEVNVSNFIKNVENLINNTNMEITLPFSGKKVTLTPPDGKKLIDLPKGAGKTPNIHTTEGLFRKPIERKRKLPRFHFTVGKEPERQKLSLILKHDYVKLLLKHDDLVVEGNLYKLPDGTYELGRLDHLNFISPFNKSCYELIQKISRMLNEMIEEEKNMTSFRIFHKEELNRSMVNVMKQKSIFRLNIVAMGGNYECVYKRIDGTFKIITPVKFSISNIENSEEVNGLVNYLLNELNTDMKKINNSAPSGLFSNGNIPTTRDCLNYWLGTSNQSPSQNKTVLGALIGDEDSIKEFMNEINTIFSNRHTMGYKATSLFQYDIDPRVENLSNEEVESKIRKRLKLVKYLRPIFLSPEKCLKDFVITIKGEYDTVYVFKGNNLKFK